jgi:hypothetical protein
MAQSSSLARAPWKFVPSRTLLCSIHQGRVMGRHRQGFDAAFGFGIGRNPLAFLVACLG